MTSAPPSDAPITHGRVLRVSLPIVLANVTVPLLGLVDTAVIGQMGQAAPIGAVGLGAVILSTVYWIFGFLRMGTTGLTAQAHGAGDAVEARAILQRGLLIALVAGLVMIALYPLILRAAFALAPASAEVETLARDYLAIRIWGAPATIAAYALTGWLIAMERSKSVLWMQLAINGLNILLSIWFVLGLGWGVAGVALGTLISEVFGLVLGLWLCRDGLARVGAKLFDISALRHMAAVNRDILIRSVILQASFTAFLFLAASHGDTALAANQILLQFVAVCSYLLDGFAFAAETLVGQAVGARSKPRLSRAVRLCMIQGGIGAGLLTLGFAAIGPFAIDAMTTAEDVRAAARSYLPWMIALPLVSVAAYMFDGIFIGATRTREMRNSLAISGAVYVAAIWLSAPLANHGLWLSLLILNTLRGFTLAAYYPRIPAALGSAPSDAKSS